MILFAVKIRLCRSRQTHALDVAIGKPSIQGFGMNSRRDGQMNMQDTKAEIEQQMGGLIGLVRHAIALQDTTR